jgi:hypothetical protein
MTEHSALIFEVVKKVITRLAKIKPYPPPKEFEGKFTKGGLFSDFPTSDFCSIYIL